VNRQPFHHLRQFESELTSIAKGYNLGARHARGEYLALFHDDCFLDDPLWIEKAISALDNGAAAITPEIDHWRQVPVAKAVPLVLRRADFIAAGGYDEYYYAGVEDMDLTVTLLRSGPDVRQLPIGYRHLRGMGTSLILHEDPHQLKLLFGYQVLPSTVIELVHRDMMQRLLENSWIRMLEGDYHLLFLKKHGQYLASCFPLDIPQITHVYESMRHAHLLTPEMAYMTNRERLVEAYRKLMNTAELSKPIHNGSGLA
jgi:glycosyltransferase involved in cell wall biosynthesis